MNRDREEKIRTIKKQSILIIIPAYNEEKNILNTLDDIKQYCPDLDCVVINDCSKDNTLRLLKENEINHISLPCNLGIGGGVQTGYQYAFEKGYDIAVQFDGDGQHQAKYLYDLIEPIAEKKADIVIGSRFANKEGFQSTSLRRLGIRFLSIVIFLLCHVHISDVTSGMRAVNRDYIGKYAKTYAQDYPEPEAIVMAMKDGARVIEIPVTMKERKKGRSSISPLRSVYYMIKVTIALFLTRFSSE